MKLASAAHLVRSLRSRTQRPRTTGKHERPAGFASLAWTCGAFAGGVLLHADRIAPWATLIALGFTAWRLLAARRSLPLPHRGPRAALAIALVVGVFLAFRTLNGLAAGTVLLVVMGSVKLLETHRRRDQFIVIGASLFLLLAACLDRQSLLRAPLYLVHAWLCCAALAIAAHPHGAVRARTGLRLSTTALGAAVPLALLLFVTFPRLSGSFWALPRSEEAVTGLGETMSPGSISQLSESEEPAFRVWFDGPPPPPQERYWRGPVLHDFDGFTWSRPRGRFYRQERLDYLGMPYRYRIALEPHQGPWWFALDTITESPRRRVFLTYDRQLVAPEPVTQATTYDAVSHTRTRARDPISLLARRYDTALPPGRNPRTLELGAELRAAAASDADFVTRALEHLRTGGFEYTLTPPRLSRDSVDDFLFDTRRGFCGHFASAFVTLMRAGGVPARIVTGYLGGEWNPIGDYFVVRQSDAHAWAEVWIDGSGWTRIDPTGVVAPERLQRGLYDLMPSSASATTRFVRQAPWLARLLYTWDALESWWNYRIVGFTFDTQLDFLNALGFESPGWRELGGVFAGGLVAWLAWVGIQWGRTPRGPRRDRLGRAYARLCRRLAHAGFPRATHEGPLAFASRIRDRRPDLAGEVEPLLRRYAELRFGRVDGNGGAPASSVAAFEHGVRRLRLSR